MMKTVFRTTQELIDGEEDRKTPAGQPTEKGSPLPLPVIPNHMGINLCSVEGLSWTRQADGQLVSLTIHFVPAEKA
jgi:hypothetical protein